MDREGELPTLPMEPGEDDASHGATYGRFVSLGVIGRGGMGVVLRARDPELDRNVAIKLLGAGQWAADPTGTQRLQREAQAMAKLSHPNVVTVYEMGQVGAERFIAMELVEGTTLRRWLSSARTWREIVAAFVECGRGLAAAHAAGLVHRDFKPENVLIGADRRPRVSDFGLVANGVVIERGDAGDDASPVTPLTVRGSVIGTPAYMAPEQWTGGEIDARTDQFAFCVALWEALYRERPFAGTVTGELREHIVAGDVRPPPRDHHVPRWIEPILRRGLSRDRVARWPSMTALLAALEPAQRPRWMLIASGAVVIAGATAAIVIATRPASDPCPDPAPRLAGIWDAAIHGRIAAAFTAANPAVAADAIERAGPALDRYAGAWRTASRAACRATRVDGTQSAELLDRRMLCLDRRRTELAALTAALATADHDRVASAVDAIGALGDLDQCANGELLLAVAPPSDPAQRKRVDALEAEIVASRAMQYANKPPERQARAVAALAGARALGHLPTLVHALHEVYEAADGNRDETLRETALRELAQRAAELHDDVLAASAWTDLIQQLSRAHRLDEAKALEPVAEAAVTRAGSPPMLRYRLSSTLASRRMYDQDFIGSIEALHAAIDVAPTDRDRATAQLSLAQVTFMKDGPTEALPLAEKATAATEAVYGPNHPRTADGLYLLAQFLVEAHQLDRAQEIATRLLAIRVAAFGSNHHDVATVLHMLGNIARARKDFPTARSYYERAVATFDALGQADEAGLARGALAGIIADADGIAAARPVFLQALDGLAKAGKDKVQYISIEVTYAQRLVDADGCAEAAPLLDHAATVLATVTPRKLPFVLHEGARCDLAAKHIDDALDKLERAYKICSEPGCSPPLVSEMTWMLGRTLAEAHRDRARAMKLIDGAVSLATEQRDDELLAEIATWRKHH